ncbi:hypothetical protein I4U23_007997 [Adineta vaga]|nr:hypothetical protein I4U23_007997 [Adineta vaga]
MSTKSNDINDKNLLITSIKLENDTDDDLSHDESSDIPNQKDYFSNLSSTSTANLASLSSAYKGKIEVTSKGRRKIFDGVRWQILCRRPECRKQTNKKSLCITHYKEEYELPNDRSPSSWSNKFSSFQVPCYRQQHLFNTTLTQNDIEDQNNTISTTNITDNNEQLSLNSSPNRSINEDQIEYFDNGRRTILKNKRWQSLCKYDHTCRNIAKFDSLCIKHFEITQQKRRNLLKFHNPDKPYLHSTLFDKYRSVFTNDLAKRLKLSNEIQRSSSSIIEQFDINSNENIYTSTKLVENNSRPLTTELTGNKTLTSSKTNLQIGLSKSSLFKKQKTDYQTDQSVQTDLSIPLCCQIHHDDHHSFYSICKDNQSTSSMLSMNTKSEPLCFDSNISTSELQ